MSRNQSDFHYNETREEQLFQTIREAMKKEMAAEYGSKAEKERAKEEAEKANAAMESTVNEVAGLDADGEEMTQKDREAAAKSGSKGKGKGKGKADTRGKKRKVCCIVPSNFRNSACSIQGDDEEEGTKATGSKKTKTKK